MKSFAAARGVLFSLFATWSATVFAQSADTILINGKIITVDDKFRTVQAVAIQRDRIVAAGGNVEIQKLKGPATQLIDVQGRTVIPGSALELTRVSGRQRQ
jgi:adenine deaminase